MWGGVTAARERSIVALARRDGLATRWRGIILSLRELRGVVVDWLEATRRGGAAARLSELRRVVVSAQLGRRRRRKAASTARRLHGAMA